MTTNKIKYRNNKRLKKIFFSANLTFKLLVVKKHYTYFNKLHVLAVGLFQFEVLFFCHHQI